MLKLAVMFAALALASGVFGFGTVAAEAATPARLLCFASLVSFAVCFVMAMTPTAFARPKPLPAVTERH
ncbi:DUF1328 domain-containing protein [Derxia gummosa]|uniref:DUF1328 domain-containing protein n=1 Tax=Derxia gummosa DSM 723 TaxID=1121388 RepID=A0A8B6X7L7_9BURK|nr:DUF1328 domain-containing protein [Derxia gummosa]